MDLSGFNILESNKNISQNVNRNIDISVFSGYLTYGGIACFSLVEMLVNVI